MPCPRLHQAPLPPTRLSPRSSRSLRCAVRRAATALGFACALALLPGLGTVAQALADSAPAAPAAATQAAPTAVVRGALVAPGDGPAFPNDGSAQPVALPDDWAVTRPGFGGTLWYRIGFNATGPIARGDLLALYIARACTNLEVHLNGQLVLRGGDMETRLTQNCNHPQLAPLPTALIQPGPNVIDIRVAGFPLNKVGSRLRGGGLSALEVGPQSLLAAKHAQQTVLNVAVPQALSATLALMGGFMFVLGFINRRESHLAYFGALSIGWAIVDARLWLREPPFSHALAEFLLCSLLGLIAWAAVQFLLRYAQLRMRWLDIALPLQAAVLPLSLVVAGPAQLYPVASFWYMLLSLQVLAAGAVHLRHQWATSASAASRWPMALLLSAVAVAGVIEFLAQWSGQRPLAAHIAQLVVPVMVVLLGLRLVQQHGRALQSSEDSRVQLQHRVREATAEIESNYRQMSELKVEQVTERERKRIAADLHDDLGAKLLTIVHTSESERISTLAREALEEMRLSVRGLTGKPVRLADALGDWRAEVVSRLAQAGIEGEWDAPEDLPQTLSARAYVQTTRILREATSNIIKHSGATHCSMRCTIADGDFQFVVQDNGDGISPELDGRLDRGHGMASMKHRAKQLQGQCLVESGPGYGTVIRLTLPLDRATE